MTTKTVTGVTYTLKDLWNKACEHDGIEANSKFVVFSKDNPWMAKYNTLLNLRYKQVQFGRKP